MIQSYWACMQYETLYTHITLYKRVFYSSTQEQGILLQKKNSASRVRKYIASYVKIIVCMFFLHPAYIYCLLRTLDYNFWQNIHVYNYLYPVARWLL